MTWKPAINFAELQKNNRQTATIDGKKILFILQNDQIYAVQAQCSHLGYPLLKGKVNDECELVCPLHKSVFDLKTGSVKCWSPWPPVVGNLLGKISKAKDLRVYATRIENDQVFVELA